MLANDPNNQVKNDLGANRDACLDYLQSLKGESEGGLLWDGKAYTVEEIYDHVKKGTKFGNDFLTSYIDTLS